MGISISIKISRAVTQKEWEKVYEEALTLVEKLPLAEATNARIKGIETFCLVPTTERTVTDSMWIKSRTGWYVEGDYETLQRAECDYTPRDLVEEKEYNPKAGDAIISAIKNCMDCEWSSKLDDNSYRLWGNKTQGYSYHQYLLAIACLIEDRLGEKAFVLGDITSGQCEAAVEIANKLLDKKIEAPARCDKQRFFDRVDKLELSEFEKLQTFDYFCLSDKDDEYGRFVREHYSKENVSEYWKERFISFNVTQRGFDDCLVDYLEMGFEFTELCDFVRFEDEEGKTFYEDFIVRIMDAKLHLQEKDCSDPLKTKQRNPHAYGVGTLFAQFLLWDARNKKINRYIPLEDIRTALIKALGEKCDVNGIIDNYLVKEESKKRIDINKENLSDEEWKEAINQDSSEVFKQVIKNKYESTKKKEDQYDIPNYEYARFYEPGDTMPPNMKKALASSRQFLDSLLTDDEYCEMSKKSAKAQKEWVSENNQFLIVRDKDWEHIYGMIEKDSGSFGRFYSIMRTDMSNRDLNYMGVALLINDDFWNYTGELAAGLENDD